MRVLQLGVATATARAEAKLAKAKNAREKRERPVNSWLGSLIGASRGALKLSPFRCVIGIESRAR